jgi:hypothetical protein
MPKILATLRLFITCVALWLAGAPRAEAIPSFARRYTVECSFCHEGYPKLNRIGERFKERGFRLENEDPFKANEWLGHVPVSGRVQAASYRPEGADALNFAQAKGIVAGNLGRRVSFWLDDAIFIQRANGESDTRHIKPGDAWVRFELSERREAYLRAGRFELDLPFTQARTPHLFAYAPFVATSGFSSRPVLGAFQEGVEAGAQVGAFRGSLALVKSRADDSFGGAFGRLSRRIGGGSSRASAFAFLGPRGDGSVRQFGVDARAWKGKVNGYGAFVHGSREDLGGLESSSEAFFLSADYHWRSSVVVTARVESVKTDFGRQRTSRTSFMPGLQLYGLKIARLSAQYDTKDKVAAFQIEAFF